MNLLDATLQGAQVTVTTRLGGPMTFEYSASEGDEGTGLGKAALAWLQPSVVFSRQGVTLYRFEPYGTPHPPNWWELAAAGLLVLTLFLLWRRG